METNELIEHLRIMGRTDDRDPNYYLLAADRLEDLQESVNIWMATFDMLNDRENRHHYLDYWREKNGESDLTYPDGDEIYKDFFAMKAVAEKLVEENERLRDKGEWKWNPNGMDWGLGAWHVPSVVVKTTTYLWMKTSSHYSGLVQNSAPVVE